MNNSQINKPFNETITYYVGTNVLGFPMYRSHTLFGNKDQSGNKKITKVIGETHY
jgi:hypothetical protein